MMQFSSTGGRGRGSSRGWREVYGEGEGRETREEKTHQSSINQIADFVPTAAHRPVPFETMQVLCPLLSLSLSLFFFFSPQFSFSLTLSSFSCVQGSYAQQWRGPASVSKGGMRHRSVIGGLISKGSLETMLRNYFIF